jgi:hypothetical protein
MFRRRWWAYPLMVVVSMSALVAAVRPADAAAVPDISVVQGRYGYVLRDGDGREVTLRGFNVSGSTKLTETGLLPFRSQADAAKSAQAMRDLTGANAIRFLISWEGVQPARDRIDTAYLSRAAAQIREFTDRGMYVLVDYHQDLYSAHLFDEDSWYDGDGAPQWVIDAGDYPDEFCGICFMWGQNMQNNAAVREAQYDFWRNHAGVQDAFLIQAGAAMAYLKQALPAASFARIVGFDPWNEPFDGGLDGGTGVQWERAYLVPFYQRFRSAMDANGWSAKPAFVEPLVFWNTVYAEQGGMAGLPAFGTRYVFNSHYYDGPRLTLDWSPASDGVYAAPMNRIRDRALALGTAPFVSEFGNAMTNDRTPWMIRGMYQGMDAGVAGKSWWDSPASGGTVLSNTMWHWDIYSGRHPSGESGDAWNDEDHSAVAVDASGAVVPRLDIRVLDRLFPSAVGGQTLAFAYEDLARSGYGGAGTQQAWLVPPSSMSAVSTLVSGRQYGVLVWRGTSATMHLPASFAPSTAVVVSDVATLQGLPSAGAVRVALETGSSVARQLIVTAPTDGVHVALVVNPSASLPSSTLTSARTALLSWLSARF